MRPGRGPSGARPLLRRIPVHRRVRLADLGTWLAVLRTGPRRAACRAVVDGLFVAVTLKRRGLRPLLQSPPAFPEATPAEARHIARAVDAGLALLPLYPTCLRRSVTLLRELHRNHLGAALCIGVRTAGRTIEAHAWIQAGEHVVNDDPTIIATYTRLSVGEAERLLPRLG